MYFYAFLRIYIYIHINTYADANIYYTPHVLREEVESALKVLLTEVKTLKSSLPAYEHLRKQIKKKADGTDVQK
jgi:hypothetical protein